MVRILLRPLLLLLVALSVNGCSLALLEKPRLADGSAARDCTTSPAIPILDAAASGLMVAGIVRVLTYESDDLLVPDVISDGALTAILAPPGLLWGYSAARGFGWTSECRGRQSLSEDAIADYLRTLSRTP